MPTAVLRSRKSPTAAARKAPYAWRPMLAHTALAAVLLLNVYGEVMAQNAPPNAPSVRRGEPITLNFENAEIEAVARTMATITGRNVVVDPRVRGTINLITESPVSPQSAFDQFLVALRLQGFTVVEAAGLYKVVPEADAKLQSASVHVSEGAFPARTPSGGQIVTQIFRLNYENAANLIPTLRPLISPNNTINVNPGTNSLVITDYADNLARIAKIVAALDISEASDVDIIPLHYAIAGELVPLLTRLVGNDNGPAGAATAAGTAGQAGSGQGFRTTILADVRSNAIIVRAANPARVSQIRSLVSQLDRAPTPGSSSEFGNMHVVFLKNANATQMAQTLRAAIAAGNLGGGAGGTSGGSGAGGAASSSGLSTGNAASTSSFGNDSSSSSSGLGSSTSFGEGSSGGSLGQVQAVSTGGIIQADPSTNSLIITAPDPLYRQLRPVIDKLDSRRAQVLIESMVVEVRADKAAEFGIQWQGGFGNSGSSNVGAIGTNYSGTGNIIDLALSAAAAASGATTGLPSSTSIGNGINFGAAHNYGGTYVLGFLARFLEGSGDANVLSTPNILTLDNEEARILIGQNVPFVTGQFTNTGGGLNNNPFSTIERQDVGISLRVKPQINEHGSVKLAVVQEVSDVVAGTLDNANGPTTSKRLIETNVLVDDGGIIVLGGLLEDRYAQSNEKVPLLGDIPIIGNAFRSEQRLREKVNLMVFLRPTVIYDAAGTDALAMERYNLVRQDQNTVQPGRHLLLDSISSAPRLPELSNASLSDRERQAHSKRRRPPLAELSRYPDEEPPARRRSGVNASDLRTGEDSGWVTN